MVSIHLVFLLHYAYIFPRYIYIVMILLEVVPVVREGFPFNLCNVRTGHEIVTIFIDNF